MVGIGDHAEVDEKTMRWLKNGGRNHLIEVAKDAERDLKKRGLIHDFDINIWLEGELMCDDIDNILFIGYNDMNDEEKMQSMTVGKGYVEYSIDWHGHHGAAFILDLLEQVCKHHGVGPVINKEGAMKMGLMSLSITEKMLKSKFDEIKTGEPFLIGDGKSADRYLAKDEIPKERDLMSDTGYVYDPGELGQIRIESPSLEDNKDKDKWEVSLEKTRENGKLHDFDTLLILCTDKDIRRGGNIVRAYRIPEYELGDKKNLTIFEDLTVSEEWEKFRDKDEKKFANIYNKLIDDGILPDIQNDYDFIDYEEDEDIEEEKKLGIIIVDRDNCVEEGYPCLKFPLPESHLILATIYDATDGEFFNDNSIFEKKCNCCLTSDIKKDKFLDIIRKSLDYAAFDLEEDDELKDFTVHLFDCIEEFLLEAKSDIIYIEDNLNKNEIIENR